MTDVKDRGNADEGICRRCHKRCSPYTTLCRGCQEDRDMGYVDDDEERFEASDGEAT